VNARIEAELALLRLHYDKVEHVEASGLHWFRVEPVRTTENWSADSTPAAFSVTQGHPGAPPYGFYIPAELKYANAPPSENSTPNQPPFAGQWRFLSWQAVDWRPTANVTSGANLWGWVRSFIQRFGEGK
jgi:hypothetical protein